jgi:hypothetical protein
MGMGMGMGRAHSGQHSMAAWQHGSMTAWQHDSNMADSMTAGQGMGRAGQGQAGRQRQAAGIRIRREHGSRQQGMAGKRQKIGSRAGRKHPPPFAKHRFHIGPGSVEPGGNPKPLIISTFLYLCQNT